MAPDKQTLEDKPADDSSKSSSRSLLIAMTIIILLALGYTVFRTLAVPGSHGSQTTSPTK